MRREAPNWAGVGDAVAWVRQLRGDLPNEQPSAASAGAGASGGAGEVVRNDTPERLPELTGEFGEHYADVDLEEGETELPVMLTLHHAVLLEAHEGGDEADVALALSFEDAEALGVRLIEQVRRGRVSLQPKTPWDKEAACSSPMQL